jgi:hypothetical protein
MSMTVNIKIGGDVIIYDKDGYWNFVFIADVDHLVNLSAGGVFIDSLYTPGRSRLLRLDISAGTRRWGSQKGKIFNMGHRSLHGFNGSNSNLELLSPPASPPDREIVRLIVPAGTLEATQHLHNGSLGWYPDYRYKRHPNGREHHIGHETAKFVTLSFTVSSSFRLMEGTLEILPAWTFVDGSTLELVLDNDCQGTGSHDDFLVYYDWVRDTTDSNKKFTARKPGFAVKDAKMLNPEGNCDPARIDPPPFP